MRVLARFLLGLCALAWALPASAKVENFPHGFHIKRIKTDGATLYVRVGGKGPAVVLLHGFGDTGDMWAPAASACTKTTRSSFPTCAAWASRRTRAGGYDKKTQGQDIAKVMDPLNVEKAALVTHDIGNMVGYALAAQFPARVTRWVIIDAPLPGIGPWDEILKSPCSGTSTSAAPTSTGW